MEEKNKLISIEPTTTEIITDSEEKQIETEELIQYKERVEQYIKLISSNDNALIDYEYIYNRGHYYIKLYKKDFLPYIEKLEQLTNKYYNSKKYTFENTNKYFEIKNIKTNSSISRIEKPNIKNVIEYLFKAKTQIQRDRHKLMEKYNNFLIDKNLTDGQIQGFNKKRTYFINKLNEYYSIQYYYNRINLINNNFMNSTTSSLISGKMEYSLKYITNEKYNNIMNTDIDLRNKFITANIDDKLIKEYIKHKLQFDKKENKKRAQIDTIILNKDIILQKFIFNNSDK
jgi:hypothetical protein